MPTTDERIARFEYMADADPDNEMAHFSLGQAYLDASRAAEAAQRFERAIEINPDMSKAYQLAGEAMIRAGWSDRAVQILERGFEVAAAKGDLMPRDAIVELLQSIGREPPQLDPEVERAADELRASGAFVCRSSGRPGTQLPDPPFRGPLGAWIHENIAAETWREWIGMGTKVINELRLDFSRDEDQRTYEDQMCEFLGIDGKLRNELESAR